MLSLEQLRLRAGPDRWAMAREQAFRSAPGTGTSTQRDCEGGSITEALDWVLDRLDESITGTDDRDELVQTLTRVYREVPSYRLLYDLFCHCGYFDFSEEAREDFWDFAREMLSEESDALADPVAYVMWCDFFESSQRVTEAWNNLISDDAPRRRIERVLDASGPVPYDLKEPVYRRLLPEASWHYWIFRSLLHSSFDMYGKTDRGAAQTLLGRLRLPPDTENLEKLRARLSTVEAG
jgi:hypothetical protein